jgi:catechol 2,3-dioxygenase-like lactoylglutathione lyase family enzyme
MRFSQVRLLVDDPGEAFRFYRDDLGLTPAWGEEGEAYASFAAGDGTVAIFARSEQADAVELSAPGDGTLLVLEVDSADEWRDKLAARVVAGPTDRPDWGGRVLHLRDPSGNLIELFQSIPMESE